MVRAIFLALLLGLATLNASAKERVDVELVIAADASQSIDDGERFLQRHGYIDAFANSNEVLNAIRGGFYGRIAVIYVEWAEHNAQYVVVPWTLIESADDARSFAAALFEAPVRKGGATSISGALEFSASQFGAQYDGSRRVIDISGDGYNNAGNLVEPIRDQVVAQGITINELPLMRTPPMESEKDIVPYFAKCVAGGEGSFMMPAYSTESIVMTVRRKLVLEIANDRAIIVLASYSADTSTVDCQAGEKLIRRERQ